MITREIGEIKPMVEKGKAGASLNSVREFPGLEILRFLCAVLVLISHYTHLLQSSAPLSDLPWFEQIGPVYRSGGFGVTVFWFISGFISSWGSWEEGIGLGMVLCRSQMAAKISVQRQDIDILDGRGQNVAVRSLTSPALGLAQEGPVGGTVAGSGKTLPIHKGFQ